MRFQGVDLVRAAHSTSNVRSQSSLRCRQAWQSPGVFRCARRETSKCSRRPARCGNGARSGLVRQAGRAAQRIHHHLTFRADPADPCCSGMSQPRRRALASSPFAPRRAKGDMSATWPADALRPVNECRWPPAAAGATLIRDPEKAAQTGEPEPLPAAEDFALLPRLEEATLMNEV